jgi:ankyrin repeat protein
MERGSNIDYPDEAN